MEINMYLNKYKNARYTLFKWRYELNAVQKVVLALSFACFTGLLAQVKFFLPWSPVPLTGQTFAVVLSAIMLGKWWGGISQSLYVGIGVAGIPWFANGNMGFSYLTGATGGYLIGFVIAAFLLGYCVDRYIRSRHFLNMFALLIFINFVIIYGLGLLQLYSWHIAIGSPVGISVLLMEGLIPFIIFEIIKITGAAAFVKAITPKQSYGNEVDKANYSF